MADIAAGVTKTESVAWLHRYYELCETDIDGAMEFWAPEGQLRFANIEPLIGREAIRSSFKEWVSLWDTETHTIVDLWELPGGVLIFELGVAFRMHDGQEFSVRGAAITRVEDGKFLEQRIYVDLGPVWAAAQPSGAGVEAVH